MKFFNYLYNATNLKCYAWIRTSAFAPYVIIIGLLFGIVVGLSISTVADQYYNTFNAPQPLIITSITVTDSPHEVAGRTLTLKLDSTPASFYPTCDRINFHVMIEKGTTNFYPISMALAGANYRDAALKPTVMIDIPNSIPGGDYIYEIRTVYICNIWPAGMITYHTETIPIEVHLSNVPDIK